MRKLKAIVFTVLALGFLFLPLLAFAQDGEQVVYNFSKVKLQWDIPVPVDGVSWAERYVVTCTSAPLAEPAVGVVAHPGNTMLMSTMLPGPGKYVCSVRAENSAGASPESDTVNLVAGGPPGRIAQVTIEAQ